MKLYELTYLITPDIPEEEINSFQKIINGFIQEEGGVLTEGKMPLRKKLAYPIKKKGTAYLGILNFNLAPEKLGEFEKKIRHQSQILRYLILVKKPAQTKEIPPLTNIFKKPKPSVFEKVGEEKLSPKKFMKPKEEKVELKEIEKKLEEILNAN